MKYFLPILAFIGLGVALPPIHARAADAAKSYENFKTLRTRNIFDPNRKAVRESATSRPEPGSRSRRSSTPTLTLTGTMVREGRTLAFFGGSRTEFNKVLSPGESIANFKVATIEPTQVRLEKDGKNLTLAIGKPVQIDRAPGDPEPTPEEATDDAPEKPDGADAASANESSAPPAQPAPGGSDSKNEILRRMMERREKELNK